jgi:hypothetical protein
MRYIIGEIRGEEILVDVVTDEPAAYAVQYEPIDLVNGELYAWNLEGDRFIFSTGTDFDINMEREKSIAIVETGKWGSEGAILRIDGKNDIELLESALRHYLKMEKYKSVNAEPNSIDQLADIALNKTALK